MVCDTYTGNDEPGVLVFDLIGDPKMQLFLEASVVFSGLLELGVVSTSVGAAETSGGVALVEGNDSLANMLESLI